MITRRDMLAAALDGHRLPDGSTLAELGLATSVVTYSDVTLREAANFIAEEGITRLPVSREQPDRMLGIVALVDMLAGRASSSSRRSATARASSGCAR